MFTRTTPAIIAASGTLLAAGAAQAAFISFASDTDPDNPTLVSEFVGFDRGADISNIILDFEPTFVTLTIDPDDDGPMGPIELAAKLEVEIGTDYVNSVEVAPGLYTHVFSVNGLFSFTPADQVRGEPVDWSLTGFIPEGGAAFTALGSADRIGSAAITGFDITYSLFDVPGLGSGAELLGDFGFTLTDINDGDGADLVTQGPVRGGNGGPLQIFGIEDYTAESSFSGSFIPTPSTLALIAPVGLIASRRRRN